MLCGVQGRGLGQANQTTRRAAAESFSHTLKGALDHGNIFDTCETMQRTVFNIMRLTATEPRAQRQQAHSPLAFGELWERRYL